MKDIKNTNLEESIDLLTIFKIFLKRKWWFIGAFILVLILGMFYTFSKPVIYEAKYKFSIKDIYNTNYLKYEETREEYYRNEMVFINKDDIPLIIKSDPILQELEEIEGLKDFKTDVIVSMIDLDIDKDKSIFTLKVKNTDRKFAQEICLNLIKSLDNKVFENDKTIYTNTLNVINDEINRLNEEINEFNVKINQINADNSIEKQGEVLIYKAKIIDDELKIKKLENFYSKLSSEKERLSHRIEILTKEPSFNIQNDRIINIITVILLSFLTGILVVLLVNYIYKLKEYKKK